MKLILLYILFLFNGSGGNLTTKLKAYLDANIKNVERYEFKLVRKPKAEKIKIDPSRKFSVSGKYAYVPVIMLNGKKKIQGYLTVRLKLFKKCYVTTREIKRGENLSPADLIVKIADVTALPKEPVTDLSEIGQFRANKFVKAGEILYKEDIEQIPLIFSGEAVEGRYISGRVMIELRVVAQQNGWKNKVIRVRGPNNKYFSAKVISRNLVLLME